MAEGSPPKKFKRNINPQVNILPPGVELLDKETMTKVARKIGKHFSELGQRLIDSYTREEGDSQDEANIVDRCLRMLETWKQEFTRDNPVATLWKAALGIGIDLSEELGPSLQNPPCPCGNNFSLKFRCYYDRSRHDQSQLIGICCVSCGQEWLKDKYLFHPDTENTRPVIELHGVFLKEQLEVPLEKTPIFQGNGFPQEIGQGDVLNVGDHIAWKRPYVIWHHAIVSGVNEDMGPGVIKVIHWSKVKWGCGTKQIMEEEITLADQTGVLHRLKYGDVITSANPTALVIARAESRIGDNEYSIANDNCESFASHCKTGVAESSQTKWFYQKVKEVALAALGQITGTALVNHWDAVLAAVTDLADSDLVEQVVNAKWQVGIDLEESLKTLSESNDTGSYIVIAMAGFAFCVNLRECYEQRKQRNLSLKEFTETVALIVSRALVSAGLAVAVGHAAAGVCAFKFPGLEIVVGGFIGWFVGNSGSLIASKSIGSFIGPPIGRVIARATGTKDSKVHIVDLNPGDHIILFSNFFHPRHHAIVVSCNQESRKVKVVNNTYERGIVEEEVDFLDPVYRAKYDQDCFPPEQVISRARSKIVHGVNEYSLVCNNCKHFAQWCKLKN